MLPPLNVLPLEGLVRIIACEPCLTAKKQLQKNVNPSGGEDMTLLTKGS